MQRRRLNHAAWRLQFAFPCAAFRRFSFSSYPPQHHQITLKFFPRYRWQLRLGCDQRKICHNGCVRMCVESHVLAKTSLTITFTVTLTRTSAHTATRSTRSLSIPYPHPRTLAHTHTHTVQTRMAERHLQPVVVPPSHRCATAAGCACRLTPPLRQSSTPRCDSRRSFLHRCRHAERGEPPSQAPRRSEACTAHQLGDGQARQRPEHIAVLAFLQADCKSKELRCKPRCKTTGILGSDITSDNLQAERVYIPHADACGPGAFSTQLAPAHEGVWTKQCAAQRIA